MCLTNNFFEKYLNAAQDEVLQSIEYRDHYTEDVQQVKRKCRQLCNPVHRISNLSPLNMKNILFTTYHLCIVLLLIFMSWGLDVRRKDKYLILKSLLLLSVDICLVEGMVSL